MDVNVDEVAMGPAAMAKDSPALATEAKTLKKHLRRSSHCKACPCSVLCFESRIYYRGNAPLSAFLSRPVFNEEVGDPPS